MKGKADKIKMGACSQCGKPMMLVEIAVLGPVCGDCCRKNHQRVMRGAR